MNVPFRLEKSMHQGRADTFQEGTPYGGPSADERRTWPLPVRVLCYILLLAVAVAVSAGLGVGISLGMEFLAGWPDTWLY